MPEAIRYIGEVGSRAKSTSISGFSLVGIRPVLPRILFLEPERVECEHNIQNKEAEELAVDLGHRVIRMDIYKDMSEFHIPPLGILFMENVTNDVAYYGHKNYDHLASNLHQMLDTSSIICLIITTFADCQITRHTDLKESFLKGGFTSIHDDFSRKFFTPMYDRDESFLSEQKKKVLQIVQNTDLVDKSLMKGVTLRLNDPYNYWMIFQTKGLKDIKGK